MQTRKQAAHSNSGFPIRRKWLACWVEGIAVVLLLATFALFSIAGMRRESPVYDEVAHLPAGITYWQRHDLRLNPEHPPLFKLLAAWPVRHAHIDYMSPYWGCAPGSHCFNEWRIGQLFFSTWNTDAPQLLERARQVMLLLALALALVLYGYGRALGGAWGGLLSLGFVAGSPFFISNGPLVLNDVGIAFFCLTSVWTFASLLNRSDRVRTAAFTISLAAALLTKFSAGLLFVVFLLLWWWESSRPAPGGTPPRPARNAGLWIGGGVLGAALIVDLVETIAGWNTPLQRLQEFSPGVNRLYRPLISALGQHPVLHHLLMPPMLYFGGIGTVLAHSHRSTFLLGRHIAHGTPLYFPLLFLFKMTPALLLALVLTAGVALACHRFRMGMIVASSHLPHVRGLVLLAAVFTLAAVASQLNIGLRHCSVPIAALTLLTALIAPCSRRMVAGRHLAGLQWISLGLVAASLASTAAVAPWFLTYFNPLIGNTPKYQIVGDSNLDWGQALPDLEAFLQQHHARSVALDYFGVVPIHVYVPEAQPWSCEDPASAPGGWIAVSASRLAAMSGRGGCEWLFRYPSKPLAGGSMYVFFLPAEPGPISSLNPHAPDSSGHSSGNGLAFPACEACTRREPGNAADGLFLSGGKIKREARNGLPSWFDAGPVITRRRGSTVPPAAESPRPEDALHRRGSVSPWRRDRATDCCRHPA